jgi:hypothetical protein
MSLQAIAPLPQSTTSDSLSEAFRYGPVFTATALVLLAMIPPTLMALALDPRALNGVSVWIKPLKFEISIAIYVGTLAWFMSFLPSQERQARRFRIWAVIAAVAAAIEMIWIGGAAYFGIASHFNRDSAFMAAIYPVMGALAVTLTLPSFVMGRAFLRNRASGDSPAFHLSLGLGLILTCVLTILVAGYMSSQPGHSVGGTPGDASGLKLLGWSRDGGDLRAAHFFATHAMHFIPLVGYGAARLLPPRKGQIVVWSFSAVFTAFVGYALLTAISGQSFLALVMG